MKQLRASNDALEKTSTLLIHQSKILRDLQNISSQQLKDLNAAEARSQKHEQARPALHIEGYCKDSPVFHPKKTSPRLLLREPTATRLQSANPLTAL
jgi:hypothetical protein